MDFQFKESTKENRTCPLGAICVECSWSMPMFETTPGGKVIEAGKMCALVSSALMSDRAAGRMDGMHAAFNEMRNKMVKMLEASHQAILSNASVPKTLIDVTPVLPSQLSSNSG